MRRVAIALSILTASCGSPAPREDAGHDAGAEDAGSDAGSMDAGSDASAEDAGVTDAGSDSSVADAGSDASLDAETDAGSPSLPLATGQDYPQGIALRDGYVYWVNRGHWTGALYTPGSLARCAVPGCPGGPEVLAIDIAQPTSVAVNETHAYIGSGAYPSPVVRCAVTGCGAVETLSAGECAPTSVALDGATLFWATYCNPGEIRSCDVDGCAPASHAGGFRFAKGLILESDTLFWVGHVLDDGIVFSCPRAGCGATPTRRFATSELAGGPRGVAVAGDTIYWAAGGSSPAIWSCPTASCEADARRRVAERNPAGPLVAGGFLYWTDFGVGYPSALRRCSLSDCEGTVELVTDALEGYVEHFVIDATHAYVTQPGTVPYGGSVVAVPLP